MDQLNVHLGGENEKPYALVCLLIEVLIEVVISDRFTDLCLVNWILIAPYYMNLCMRIIKRVCCGKVFQSGPVKL